MSIQRISLLANLQFLEYLSYAFTSKKYGKLKKSFQVFFLVGKKHDIAQSEL